MERGGPAPKQIPGSTPDNNNWAHSGDFRLAHNFPQFSATPLHFRGDMKCSIPKVKT